MTAPALSPEARALVDQAVAQGFGETVTDPVAIERVAAIARGAVGTQVPTVVATRVATRDRRSA